MLPHHHDRLEAINSRQLATATDRLLVLGLPRKHLARGSYARIEVPTAHTVVVARAPRRGALYAAVVILATLAGFATTAMAQHDSIHATR